MLHADHELDARGLNCPLPILRTKKAIASMQAGELLKLTATDPGSIKDIEAYCKQTGNQLVETLSHEQDFEFYIRKG